MRHRVGAWTEAPPDLASGYTPSQYIAAGDQILRAELTDAVRTAAKIEPPGGWTMTQRLQQFADWAQAHMEYVLLFGGVGLLLIAIGGRRR
jgi:hypothetical protein